MNIILGSASKWRQQILKDAGVVFTCLNPDIDEKAIRHSNPEQLVLALANAKADALLPKITTPSLLITADQVVAFKDEIREKPETNEQARYYLKSYAEHYAETFTAVVVTNTQTRKRLQAVDRAKVYMKPIPDSIIDDMIQAGHIFHCAGGFQIEGDDQLSPYVETVEGDVDSVKGLPLKLTLSLLKRQEFWVNE